MHVSLHASEKHSLPSSGCVWGTCQARRSSALARGEDGAREQRATAYTTSRGERRGHPTGAHTEGDRMAKQSPRDTEKEDMEKEIINKCS